jgi:hypothetical protein
MASALEGALAAGEAQRTEHRQRLRDAELRGGAIKPSLPPAVKRWTSRYVGTRPLDARLAQPRALHDRVILVDNKDAWVPTQSLNAFAERSPASILKTDGETAPPKVAAYNQIYHAASPVD